MLRDPTISVAAVAKALVRYAVSWETVLTRSEDFASAVEIGTQEWYKGLGGVLSNTLILLDMRTQAANPLLSVNCSQTSAILVSYRYSGSSRDDWYTRALQIALDNVPSLKGSCDRRLLAAQARLGLSGGACRRSTPRILTFLRMAFRAEYAGLTDPEPFRCAIRRTRLRCLVWVITAPS
jgi:hypothetical protein